LINHLFKYLLLLILFFINSFLCFSQEFKEEKVPIVEFCNLIDYQNEIVISEFNYSGFLEYWSMYGPNKCENHEYYTDLNTWEYYENMPEKFRKLFSNQKSHEVLRIKAKGIFNSGNTDGYGHLGSYTSEFLVIEILEVRKMNK
jgi:hypothetical protein